MEGLKKAVKIFFDIIIWIVVIFAIIITIISFASQSDKDGIPSVAGNCIMPVKTDSMEPTIMTGDLIITKRVTENETLNFKVGDIISFRHDLDGDGVEEINTHRIVEVTNAGEADVSYTTKGDKYTVNDSYSVPGNKVVAYYTGTRIPFLGSFINFLQQPLGFWTLIFTPLALFFVYELIVFVKKFMEISNEKNGKVTISAEDEEMIKKRAIEEYLREQNAAQEKFDKNVEAKVAEKKQQQQAPKKGEDIQIWTSDDDD